MLEFPVDLKSDDAKLVVKDFVEKKLQLIKNSPLKIICWIGFVVKQLS